MNEMFAEETIVDVFLYLLIAVFSVALAAWVIRIGIFFFRRVRESDKPNPLEAKETLGLPKGAVRTFLMLSLTAFTIIALLSGEELFGIDDKKWILGEFGIVMSFYFGSKAIESVFESRAKQVAIQSAQTHAERLEILGISPRSTGGTNSGNENPAP